MKTSRALATVSGIILVTIASVFITAAAHPDSGLNATWRMLYSIGGTIGTAIGAAMAAVCIDNHTRDKK